LLRVARPYHLRVLELNQLVLGRQARVFTAFVQIFVHISYQNRVCLRLVSQVGQCDVRTLLSDRNGPPHEVWKFIGRQKSSLRAARCRDVRGEGRVECVELRSGTRTILNHLLVAVVGRLLDFLLHIMRDEVVEGVLYVGSSKRGSCAASMRYHWCLYVLPLLPG